MRKRFPHLIGAGIHRNHNDTRSLGFLDRRANDLRVDCIEQDEIRAGRDKVVDLVDLLREIVIR
jgi:hypothetical protein